MTIKPRKPVLQFAIAVCGVFMVLFGLTLFHRYLLATFPLPMQMVLMIVTQWLLFLVPGMLMLKGKEGIRDLGFRKENLSKQICIGMLLAFFMSAVFTVLPISLGLKEYVGSTSHTQPWQFIYHVFYMLFGVALAEELVFRGYLFHKLLEIRNSRRLAILLSSALFGLFHIFGGNWMQVVMTAVIGLIYCIMREKIKGCTLLSLIIAHGLYNAMITLWVSVL